jgi:hypothetical protein
MMANGSSSPQYCGIPSVSVIRPVLLKGRRMGVAMKRVVFVGLMGQVLLLSGCYGTAVCLRGALTDYKRTDEIQVPFTPGSQLVIRNEAGAVRIGSDEGTDCRITAKVYVHTPHKQEAREIGEQVQIAAEPNEGVVRITIRKPPMPQDNRFVSVDLDILIPSQAHVDCETQFGEIRLTGIEGDVKAVTQFGAVVCEKTQGALELETQFGRIVGREIMSDHLVAHTQFGSVDIACSESCPEEVTAEVRTEWGKVRFKAPPDYQGAYRLETDWGAVRSALPITGPTEISHHRIVGTRGSGNGDLHLSSEHGSVRLR